MASEKISDEQIDAMSDGNFYHYMLDKDHYEWARQINRRGKLGLDTTKEETLAIYLASAMTAQEDRPSANYIRARLDSGD